MEPRHHYRSKRVWRKCRIDVRRSPCATVDEITDRHDGLEKLAFQPLFNVVDYFSINGRIAAGVKLLGEERHEVAIAAKIAICFDYVAAEGVANDLPVLRGYAETMYRAKSWSKPRSEVSR